MNNWNMDAVFTYFGLNIPDFGIFFIKVILAIAAYYIGSKIVKWLCKVFKRNLLKANAPAEAVTFLVSFAKAALLILLVFVIALQLGVKESSVAALLASAGVALGLALQGGLSNLAAGVMILLVKPFVAGDYIIESVNDNEGTVKKIELYYTTLTTYDNRMIVIPNSTLANNMITNVTAMNERLLEIVVGLAYDTDLRRTKDMLLLLLQNDEDILQDQEMHIFVESLSEHGIRVGFRAWVATERYMTAKWRINEKMKLAFDQAGITLYQNPIGERSSEQ